VKARTASQKAEAHANFFSRDVEQANGLIVASELARWYGNKDE